VAMIHELQTPGTLTQSKEYPFEFDSVEKQFESYNGLNVRLRYFVRCTITRSYSANIAKEQEFWVQCLSEAPEINNTIKMEVGIEDCLHIEFEYDKAKYNLKDVIIGKIYFLLVCIKIKHMEITIIKRETAGSGANATPGNETVTKFEIMDGAPVRGESIPVRLFLEGFPLTPTYRNVNSLYSVRYYVNLVLVDEEDRRYFKQQEITLWRNEIG
jgi:vacuolar protein sorting-associated protein 26